MAIRSILWLGSAKGLAASGLPASPGFDVVWERDVERAEALALSALDAAVVEGEHEAARAAAARLTARRPDLPVHLHDGDTAALHGWLGDLGGAASQASRPRAAAPPVDGLVGRSAALEQVRWLADRAARSEAGVLIQGETGTGKELVARAIHRRSARARGPFVAVNCAAFPDTLLESELLGHERGAFSGADRERRGLVEEAHGGTLFLDEVAETSHAFQAKLLRVLQERMVRRLGANRERPVDLRVVAATHRDLSRAVARGTFREDLFYRLAVIPLAIPPLRERSEDVPLLVRHFLARHAGKVRVRDSAPPPIDAEVMRLLQSHRWPGNVRELENEVQHALALAEPGETLRREHFSPRLGASLAPLDHPTLRERPDEPLRDTVARLEAHLIRQALDAHGGRRSETAQRLGLTREGLYKKMKRLGIG